MNMRHPYSPALPQTRIPLLFDPVIDPVIDPGIAPVIDRFVCILADTDEARRLHHQVRFRVFCEETGFEDPDAFPDQIEQDRYDQHARHFIVWDRQQQRCAGAMRLVDAARTTLPCQDFAAAPLDHLAPERHRSVEFSRLCILSDYRRTTAARALDDYQPQGADATAVVSFRQYDNDVLLRLLRASFVWAPRVQYCYFIVTAALARVLSRFGIPLTQVGQPLEHRGTRIPYRYEVEAAEAGMQHTLSGFAALAASSDAYVTASDFFSGRSDALALHQPPEPRFRAWRTSVPINPPAALPPNWLPTRQPSAQQPVAA